MWNWDDLTWSILDKFAKFNKKIKCTVTRQHTSLYLVSRINVYDISRISQLNYEEILKKLKLSIWQHIHFLIHTYLYGLDLLRENEALPFVFVVCCCCITIDKFNTKEQEPRFITSNKACIWFAVWRNLASSISEMFNFSLQLITICAGLKLNYAEQWT